MNIKHIAFIADGNRRWAKRKFLPRTLGHKKGFENMIDVADYCFSAGIPVVSFFAFSTENWNREKEEIEDIFDLIRKNIEKQTKHFIKEKIRVVFWGDLTRFPDDFQKAAIKCSEETKVFQSKTLALCVNYGGKLDIIQAVNNISGEINEESITRCLYSYDVPDPDIVVRTSGEKRISNFLLWQMAYSELFFIDTLWPDVNHKTIDMILHSYNKRNRRNGK